MLELHRADYCVFLRNGGLKVISDSLEKARFRISQKMREAAPLGLGHGVNGALSVARHISAPPPSA
ncbi:hypothetical protein [Streptomyces sp. LS1784]|uniref:hypothetical protein n=1 Tax=Streptomyces sp. LS1784 TaxID=2851533 RepID=UPI001CD0172A|nr:hypothetical protein [Streptomyces sp. LS1784]